MRQPLTMDEIQESSKRNYAFKQAEQRAALGERTSLRYKIQYEIKDIRDCLELIKANPHQAETFIPVVRSRLERIEHYLK